MKIAVLTGNQPRHIALVERLAEAADVVAVLEATTLFPGKVGDLHRSSDVMSTYFQRVMRSEAEVFGGPRPLPAGVRAFVMRLGDLNMLPVASLAPIVSCDQIIVFGASFIRPPLVEVLVERGAVNIHMGTSPFYRGSSCNFWALYDRRPDLVGATIHRLTAGLDSGPILFNVFPALSGSDGFTLGMRAVKAAQEALVERIIDGTLGSIVPVPQDRSLEMRYTRSADFSDEVATEYLARLQSPEEIDRALAGRETDRYVNTMVR
jgi:methionyl-tRNA formyltransferase